METPYIRIEESGRVIPLRHDVTTVGRAAGADVRLADPSVSALHAEIIRRGPFVYVSDLGLSRSGTRVNGYLVSRWLLSTGDVITFGAARCRVGGIAEDHSGAAAQPAGRAVPELTRREAEVVALLCRRAQTADAFAAPATAREIAAELVVTEAAVKGHLLRLYQKFGIAKGPDRRLRLANEVVALGLVQPAPPPIPVPPPAGSAPAGTQPPGQPRPPPPASPLSRRALAAAAACG
jgi:DNA-binding CsgD family transcriptional regulator